MMRCSVGGTVELCWGPEEETAELTLTACEAQERRALEMTLRFLAQSAGEPASHRNRGQIGTRSRAEFMLNTGPFNFELPEYFLIIPEIVPENGDGQEVLNLNPVEAAQASPISELPGLMLCS